MIGIIMAGGKGKRMELSEEKLLLKYKKPIILHVIDALKNSKRFSKIIAVTSPHSPKTQELLKKLNIELFSGTGTGYACDLNCVLTSIDDDALIVSGDLPFLDSQIIQQIIQYYNPKNTWTSFLVTKTFLENLSMSSDFIVNYLGQECLYTGISLVNAKKIDDFTTIKESYKILNDKRIAFNLNTKRDYELLRIS